MSALRRNLIALVVATMSCQMAGFAATQVVFWQARSIAAGEDNQVTCTCVHGADGECPMHRKHSSQPDGATHVCSTTDSSIAFVLTSLIGAPGVVTNEQPVIAAPLCSGRVIDSTRRAVRLDIPPALPPPRA